MKTKTTFITIFAVLISFSGVIAQNTEGVSNLANDTANKKTNNPAMEIQQPEEGTSVNRSLAAAELINYQAVARDAGGALIINSPVTIDFEIRNGASGSAVYNETQNLNTDANGVFSAQIGVVTPLSGVNWLNIDPYIHVTMNGTSVGETQMGSVPTALHSTESGMITIHGSGTNNPDKMIAKHSDAFPGWGIGYNDASDDVDFMAGGTKTLSIDLGTGNLTTQGNLEVNQTTTSPALNRIYGNSVPIAFGSVALGFNDIQTGYGIASFSNPAVGQYDIVLDHDTDVNNCIVLITPFTGAFGTPEIAGYAPTGPNSFTVRIQTAAGVARDSAFTFVVYGNQ